MNDVSLSDLGGNLYTIALMAYDRIQPEEVKTKLVPSIYGNRLYSRGLRRFFLKVYYAAYTFFTKEDLRSSRYRDVMVHTYKAYEMYAIKLEKNLSTPVPTTGEHASPHSVTDPNFITNWNNWIHPILKYHIFKNLEDVEKIFQHQVLNPSIVPMWVKYDACITKAKEEQKILDVETALNLSFPRDSLTTLMNHSALEDKQKSALDQWIKALNTSKPKTWWNKASSPNDEVGVRKLHKALRVFVDEKLGKESDRGTLADLEYQLQQLGCKIFDQIDQQHLKWRQAVINAKKITYQEGKLEKVIPLGTPLGKTKDPNEDKHIVLPITDDPAHVVVIGPNQTSLGIEEQQFLNNSYEAPERVKVHLLDRKGKFKLMERMMMPLSEHKWKENEYGLTEIDDRDLNIVNLIIHMIKKMTQTPPYYTVQPLSPQDLFLNATEEQLETIKEIKLKSVKELGKETFNFDRLVDFLMSFNHKPIYHYIMNQTGLGKHKEGTFYQAVVDNTFGEKKPIIEIASSVLSGLGNASPELLSRAGKLEAELNECLNACYVTIAKEYEVDDIKAELEAELSRQIKNCYAADLSAGRLWPTFREDVLKDTHHFLALRKLKLKSTVVNARTQKWIDSQQSIDKQTRTPQKYTDSLKADGIYCPTQQQEALKRFKDSQTPRETSQNSTLIKV